MVINFTIRHLGSEKVKYHQILATLDSLEMMQFSSGLSHKELTSPNDFLALQL